jgi:hypothetical protein
LSPCSLLRWHHGLLLFIGTIISLFIFKNKTKLIKSKKQTYRKRSIQEQSAKKRLL